MNGMNGRVVVTGGRDFDDILAVVGAFHDYGPFDVVAHGGARGADQLAASVARVNRIPTVEYAADWKAHGRAAGPIRNREMLDHFRPDVVLAFPGGRGTSDCVKAARERGIRVIEIVPAEPPDATH